MNNVNIKEMSEIHINDVYKISKNSFPVSWTKEELKKEVYRDKSYNIVALSKDTTIGFIQSWFFINEADILNIAVDKEFRNKKIGYMLLLSLLNHLKEIKIETVFLEVRISNYYAQKLYKKLGFKVLYIRDNYYIDGEDAYIMVLDIKNKTFIL